MDLLVRATRTDHTVVDHFLAPTSAGRFGFRQQPIGAVVADATVAMERPRLAQLSRDAGVPFIVDPVTPLLQSEQPADDSWAKLPFAHAAATVPADLNEYAIDDLVESTITFQRERNATHLIPPYLYSNGRGDAWWQWNLQLLRGTARYLAAHDISLPVVPVLAASLTAYGPSSAWGQLDAYLDATKELNTEAVALSWSWNGASASKEARLALLLGATEHAASRANVVGWRSGTYGLAMAAVGAGGYETGIGARENLHYVTLMNSRKPKPPSASEPRGQAYVYLSQFGRSVPRKVGQALLNDPVLAGSLVCSPANDCCADGADSMIRNWREHAIRERRRELQELESMPPAMSWRLHHVEQVAARAATLAHSANQVLDGTDARVRLPEDTFTGLQRVAASFRERSHRDVA